MALSKLVNAAGPTPLLRPVPAHTKGDNYLHYILAAWFDNPDRKYDYIWGAAGTNADGKGGDPEWDCSGLWYAGCRSWSWKA